MHSPILIVGAGPVGLTLALELSRHKVPVRIIDKKPALHKESRALGLHSRTLEIFEKMGVIEKVLDRGDKVYQFQIFLKDQEALNLDFSILQAPYPFIFVLPQNETEKILIEELIQYDVQIERQTELIDIQEHENGLVALVKDDQGQKETLKTPWVIGCDGAHSKVRKLMKTEFEGFRYPNHYLLADVMMSWNEKVDTLRGYSHPKGSVLVIPIKAPHYRVVCDLKNENPSMGITQSHLKQMILQRIPEDVEVEDIEWLTEVKFSCKQAQDFRKRRLFIAGDAAHVHSPMGGQGLNCGVQDAFNLAWKLAYVYQYKARTKLLASYSRERKPIVGHILKNTHRMMQLASQSTFFLTHYRDFILKLFNGLGAIKKLAIYDLSGISVHYKKSAIVSSQKRWLFFLPAIKAGERFIDAELLNAKTKNKIRTFDLIHSPQHHLFLFFKKKHFEKAKEVKEALNKEYAKVMGIHLVSSSEDIEGQDYWIDPNKHLAHAFRLGASCMVLVRPDGYIGLTKKGLRVEKVQYYYKELLQLPL